MNKKRTNAYISNGQKRLKTLPWQWKLKTGDKVLIYAANKKMVEGIVETLSNTYDRLHGMIWVHIVGSNSNFGMERRFVLKKL